jgi:hypothetical protein
MSLSFFPQLLYHDLCRLPITSNMPMQQGQGGFSALLTKNTATGYLLK